MVVRKAIRDRIIRVPVLQSERSGRRSSTHKEADAVQYTKRCLRTVVLTKKMSQVEDGSMKNESKVLQSRISSHRIIIT